MKAKVDTGECIGCGLCAQTCPDVFSMEGDAVVVTENIPATYEACCNEASDECPVTAITVTK